MLKTIIAAYLIVANVCAQSVLKAGLRTSLDIAVLQQAKDAYFDEILKLINNLALPDVEDGQGNYLKDNTFVISEKSTSAEFFVDVEKNAVIFANKKVSAVAKSGNFRYKAAPLIVAKGHAEVDMNTVDIEAGLSFSTTTLRSGHVVPHVKSVDVKCNINRFDINIKLWGNLVTDLASAAEVLFVGTVAAMIEETIVVTLNNGIPLITNQLIARTNGYFPMFVFPNWFVDWQTPESIIVSDTNVALGIKALLFDKTIGEEEPAVAIPDMPYHMNTHIEKFQTYLSSYTIDSFFSSILEVEGIKGWIRSSEIPSISPVQLTTTTLNVLLPGIMSYYGAGQPVDIYFNVFSLGDFQSFEGNQEMDGVITLELDFWVWKTDGTQEKAAALKLSDTQFGFIAPIDNMSLTIAVERLNVGSVDVLSCAFGKLSGLTIKLEINNGFRVVQPELNHWLAKKPINFPTNILGLFELQQLTLSYYNNYIYAGLTPIFIGPTSTKEVTNQIFQSIQ